MTTITIRVPATLKKDLEQICRAENKTISDFARESILKHLAREQFRAVRKQILPFAEAQGLLTDDDIFENLK